MMNDDNQFDAILREAAQDYNKPPSEIPRDAMWAGIEAAQADRASRPLHIVPQSPGRSFKTYTWLGAAVAAMLLIATGIGIGRWSSTSQAPRPVASAIEKPVAPPASAVSEQPTVSTQPSTDDGQRTTVIAQRSTDNGQRSTVNGQRATGDGHRVTGNGERASGNGQRVADNGQRVTDNGQRVSPEVPYQVATIRHLANAEALLTAFRTDSRDAKMDAQLSKWARDLLSNT